MDIWDTMYEKAKPQFHPEEVSPFIYAHHVVCAIEAETEKFSRVSALRAAVGFLICAQNAWPLLICM